MEKERIAYIKEWTQMMSIVDMQTQTFKKQLIKNMEQELSKAWYCDYWDEFVYDETREERDKRWAKEDAELAQEHEQPIQRNPADEWWERKMKLPIGQTGLFKCLTCRFAYASQSALEKHSLKCKKPKIWRQEWVEDTMENRKEWRRSA